MDPYRRSFIILPRQSGGIRQYGYDFDKIIAEYSNLELSKGQFQLYRDIFSSIKN